MNSYRLIIPDYRGGCIADVPGTAGELLGLSMKRYLDSKIVDYEELGEFDNVVLLVVDGLGRDILERELPPPSVFEIDDFKTIDSVYPSTTAAGITSLNTGLEPCEHGLIEWEVWDKEKGKAVKPLPSVDLDNEHVDIEKFFEGKPIYSTFSELGVDCHVYQPEKNSGSAFSEALMEGAESHGYANLCDLFVTLADDVNRSEGSNYFYAYVGDVDKLSHHHGPESEHVGAQVEQVFHLLEKEFLRRIDGGSDTCLIVTADHGQIDVSGSEMVDISAYDEVWDQLYIKDGKEIPPTGGPRDMLLNVKNQATAIKTLRKYFGEVSDLYRIDKLLNIGMFGNGDTSKLFDERIGDILVLPRKDRKMYYSENHEGIKEMKGMHGGVSEEEVKVPLFVGSVEDIKKKR